jgi:hypothetical protein
MVEKVHDLTDLKTGWQETTVKVLDGHLPSFTAGRLPAGQQHRCSPASADNAVRACTARHQKGPTP